MDSGPVEPLRLAVCRINEEMRPGNERHTGRCRRGYGDDARARGQPDQPTEHAFD